MKNLIIFMMVTVMVLLTGCGSDEGTRPLAVDKTELSTREIPANIQSLIDNLGVPIEVVESNDLAASSNSNPGASDSLYNVYSVTFIWGSLANAVTPSNTLPVVDWSGSLTVTPDGMISATRPIAFEQEQDYLIPVTTPRTSAWVSKTSGDFDGLNFIIRLSKNTVLPTEGAISFETTPFAIQLTETQMKWFSAYYQISNTSGIAVQSRWIPPADTLKHGLTAGHWIKTSVSGDSGSFNGLWLDENNTPAGVFCGIFWTQSDGCRKFSGSVSGYYTDQVIAYLRGNWYYDDPRDCALCGSGHGRFYGFFRYTSSNADAGVIGGEFGDLSLPPDQLDLPLSGYWAELRYSFVTLSANNQY